MLKDPTEFRLRFAAWREGELVYEAGLPKYLDGKDLQWDTFNYKIPYIPEKSIKLTNAGLATGARISTNMLDSLANTAEEIGLPIQTAIGLATKESTLGNPTDDRSMRTLLSTKNREALEHELWKRGIRGNDQYGQHLVPDDAKTFNWDLQSLINYYNGERHRSDTFDRKENINNLPSTLKKGLLFYKDHPDKYNPGQKNYQRLVDKRGAEVMGSPEVLKWLKERNIKKAIGNFNRINPLLKESKFNLPVYNDGKLPKYGNGNDPEPIQAAKNAINFAKLYYGSEGFNERFKNLNESTKGFLYSSYNPTASYWPEDNSWDPHPKHAWSVLKTPIKFKKAGPLPSPEANAYYNKYSGTILYGDDRTLSEGYSKTWDEVMAHEAGHALDYAIKVMNKSLRGDLDNYNNGYGYTYSNLYPIFRKSKSYLKVRNLLYNIEDQHGKLYDQDPSYGGYLINDSELFHDAMPSESYADLFLLRKMLYDLKIYDSTKKGIKFTKLDFEKFKKNNHKIRLQDNFSDDDIIWMINNVAENNRKINPLSV